MSDTFVNCHIKSTLNLEQVEALKTTFILFDRNGDGKVSEEELKLAFANLGQNPSDEEIKNMMLESDTNGDGQIDFIEFLKLFYKSY